MGKRLPRPRGSTAGAIAFCVLIGAAAGVGLRMQAPSAAPVALASGVPTQLTAAQLARYARASDREVYWLGPMKGRTLEVTEAGANGLFVRYLPAATAAGSSTGRFTTVASYPVKSAYRVALASAHGAGSVVERLGSGGVAVWRRSLPTNVYVAYPGSGVLVEIFDPEISARKLARSLRVARAG
jgi:hypothetical protein